MNAGGGAGGGLGVASVPCREEGAGARGALKAEPKKPSSNLPQWFAPWVSGPIELLPKI